MSSEKTGSHPILVTGATGYIGGKLVPLLLSKEYRVRCLARNADRLQGRPWQNSVEVVKGDVLKPETLSDVMQHVKAAYYLIHSMGSGSGFHERDLRAAENFSRAAHSAGVERIIYLGGLATDSTDLSEHLRSRLETGKSLRTAGVPVTEFRAGVIVGSGSISFEMIRYLTERVPVMICPRWVYTRTQPIGINDVMDYLVSALEVPESAGHIVEIGSSDITTYGAMMTTYAKVRGLKRRMLPVPVLTPRLSSYWVNLVTPIPANIARPLIDGLRNENIVSDPVARKFFPDIQPKSYQSAVERALKYLQAEHFENIVNNALLKNQKSDFVAVKEGMILEHRQRTVHAHHSNVYRVFTGLGGKQGWLYMNWAWKIRGAIDRMFGGADMRNHVRDSNELKVGDALDFWRVEKIRPKELLRLKAEMKVPGQAWLQFQVKPVSNQQCLLAQTAFFAPKGLVGVLYWYALYPVHKLIFNGLINRIAQRAVENTC